MEVSLRQILHAVRKLFEETILDALWLTDRAFDAGALFTQILFSLEVLLMLWLATLLLL